MKVIKSINNNVSHCLDSKGREVIVFGKGIGFYKSGEDIPLSAINRTFYNVKDTDFGVINSLSVLIINTSIYIMDYVSDRLSCYYPSSAALTLADHLQFAIERKNNNIYLPQPLIQDLSMLYPEEMQVAYDVLRIIEKATGVKFPRIEAGTLAMHFINDRIQPESSQNISTESIIAKATKIIEEHFGLEIDKESFNYSRFVTHLDYLVRRLSNNEQITSSNSELFDQIKQKYPESINCANRLAELIREDYGFTLSSEEVLYLCIHINRMISRM